jgi:hypothetical protein
VATSDIDVEAETDGLYQLPLAEFTAARNALAARLKSGGDKEQAALVRALPRPGIPAWAVNQTYWTARAEFDALVLSTRRLQRAQVEGVAGADLRDAMKERREAQGIILKRAASLLEAAGHGAGQDTLRRVSDAFEALALWATRPDGAPTRPGRLVGDLEPPGFEWITALGQDRQKVAPVGPPTEPESPAAATPDERAAALERARRTLAEAEQSLEQATREAREAEGARSLADGRAQAARGEVDEAARRLDGARERAALARDAAAKAQAEADRRATARDAAEAARDGALRLARDLE